MMLGHIACFKNQTNYNVSYCYTECRYPNRQSFRIMRGSCNNESGDNSNTPLALDTVPRMNKLIFSKAI